MLDELERVAPTPAAPRLVIQDHSDELLRSPCPRVAVLFPTSAGLPRGAQTVEGSSNPSLDHKTPVEHYRYFLTTPSGKRFSLHFVANPPGLLSGARSGAGGLSEKGGTRGPQ